MTNFIYVANIQVFRQDDGILQIVIPQLPKKVEGLSFMRVIS